MKQCKKCLLEKDESEFYPSYYKDKVYLLNACKACTLIRTSKNYLKDHERQKGIRKKNTNNRRFARKQILLEYLLAHPCVDCPEKDPVVLEFDHLGDKLFDISDGLMRPLEIFLEEISKCEVVCANCHKRRTAKRAGDWYKDVKISLDK
jgi:hypothetical protein